MAYADTIQKLRSKVRALHGCDCRFETTTHVHETLNGRTVWKGTVTTSKLDEHPKATKAFAWAYRDLRGEVQSIAVLCVPPLQSPRQSVQAAIATGEMRC